MTADFKSNDLANTDHKIMAMWYTTHGVTYASLLMPA